MTRRTFPTILLAATLALGGCGGSGDDSGASRANGPQSRRAGA